MLDLYHATRDELIQIIRQQAERLADQERRLTAQRQEIAELRQTVTTLTEPGVPATNNAAERSLRHLVTIRKISGGTRSAKGTRTRMALASLYGTWRLQGVNPDQVCRELLANPRV